MVVMDQWRSCDQHICPQSYDGCLLPLSVAWKKKPKHPSSRYAGGHSLVVLFSIIYVLTLNLFDLYHRNFCPSWSVSGPLLTQKQAGSIHVSGAPFICKCGILRHKAALCVLSLSQKVQLLKWHKNLVYELVSGKLTHRGREQRSRN